ncbi:uncharacterized protein LOC117651783 [Thrips palmi]|uniref:Uncharacterized protein LOC117651783 n=1 Tax=Thrips palmi TaxID=161013 RepID=A0A6P9A463_THRPL|nr:uncharacterized protein LOC117651783 [Thrips palmi]XP_034252019.1 uncharacterized protein LOC117651783 [Thrips palmi]
MSTCESEESENVAASASAQAAQAPLETREQPCQCPSDSDGEPVHKAKSPSDSDNYHENCPSSFSQEFLAPLIRRSDDRKLYDWLLRKNLLKTPAGCIDCAKTKLCLQHATDLWVCEDCGKSFSIRQGSFFDNIPYSIREILSCVMAWSNKKPATLASQTLEMKITFVNQIYQQCIETISIYLDSDQHPKDWSIGGEGSVALLDLWPGGSIAVDGLFVTKLKRSYKDRLRVLWIADTNHVPVRYVAHLLPPQKSDIQEVKEEFEKIKLDFGVFLSPESDTNEAVNLNCDKNSESGQDFCENINGDTDNQSKRPESRILREQQEVAITPEDGRLKQGIEKKCQTGSKRKNQEKQKLQCPEKKLKEMKEEENFVMIHDIKDGDVNVDFEEENVSSLSSSNTKQEKKGKKNDRGKETKVDEEKCMIHIVKDSDINVDFEEENVSSISTPNTGKNKKKDRKPRVSPKTRALRQEAALRVKIHEEYIRNLELANAVVQVAVAYIVPGSLVVVNDEVLPYVASSLHSLGIYESVTTINNIISTGDHSIMSILENIWSDAADLCTVLQTKTFNSAKPTVAEFQWRKTFGSTTSEAVFHILSQIAVYYKHTPKEKRLAGKIL